MFESIRMWLEDLFRPVITVNQTTGTSYLERSPTSTDIAVLAQAKTAIASQTLGGAGNIDIPFTVPQGGRWLIREVSFVTSNAAACSLNRFYYTVNKHEVYGYPSVGAYTGNLGMGLMGISRAQPVVLNPGETFGFRCTVNIATTLTLTIVYSEV